MMLIRPRPERRYKKFLSRRPNKLRIHGQLIRVKRIVNRFINVDLPLHASELGWLRRGRSFPHFHTDCALHNDLHRRDHDAHANG